MARRASLFGRPFLGACSFEFIALIAESLGLSSDALDIFFDRPNAVLQHRSKVVKYPPMAPGEDNQGVGPHYDAGFLTFVSLILVLDNSLIA